MEYVSYKPFGAKGDGVTNDAKAIAAAHAYANEHDLPVKSEEGVCFYISEVKDRIVVQTNTDWTGTTFLIDDTEVPDDIRKYHVFNVESKKQPYQADCFVSMKKYQEKLEITLPEASLLIPENDKIRRYKRSGGDANDGLPQNECIVVDREGNVDPRTPIIWDYDDLSSLTIIPIDEESLSLRGGTFITRAPAIAYGRGYYGRGIFISRSNVVVDGLCHYIENEGVRGAPYLGILAVQSCTDITVRNCIFTPHIYFRFLLPDGVPYGQGTYDILLYRAVNVTFENCTQSIDILDTRCWGIMGSNYCKNIVMKNCELSRFDAHQGVANVTIIGCTFGHHGVAAIGIGTLHVEDSTLYGNHMITLRSDFGSHWEGNALIKNCRWIPMQGRPITHNCSVIGCYNMENHDYGYPCCMPHTVEIDGLYIDDSFVTDGGCVSLFGGVNDVHTDEAYESSPAYMYPYQTTEKLILKNLTTESGKDCVISPNPYLFRNTKIISE